MLNYILTILIPLIAIIAGGYKNVKKSNAEDLFSKNYTSVLKGICCIIVVMVHVRDGYKNSLQDAIGSFAYVCVTLFFMISAYGMQLSVEKKTDYIKHFWRNRLLALLIPCLFINIFSSLLFGLLDNCINFNQVWYINNYVLVLLEYCLWFYIIMKLQKKLSISKTWIIDIMLISGVLVSSLISFFIYEGHFGSNLTSWRCERFGLIWGLLFYRYIPLIKRFLIHKRLYKTILFTLLCMIFGIMYLRFKSVYFWGEYILKIILGLVIIVWMMLLTVKRQFGNRFSFWLGKISYEVYLLHTIVMFAIIKVSNNLSSGLFILITYIFTLIISTIINWCSNKVIKKLRI